MPEVKMSEFRILVETNQGLKKIDEISHLARTLKGSEEEKLTFCIYTNRENIDVMKNFDPEIYIEFSQTRLGKFI